MKYFFIGVAGIFLLFPSISQAATNVYYSVGQNTNNHCGPNGSGTGCGDVSISSGLATFTVAQTGSNLGVGDVLTAGGNTYYFSLKVSTTQWNVRTNLGAIPGDLGQTAVTSITHAFASLSAALPSGAGGAKTLVGNSNLTAIDVQLNIPCYYDTGADTTAVTVDGWTTDIDNYIKIYTPTGINESNQNQRHTGKWDASKYQLGGTFWYYPLTISDNYVKLQGIQMLGDQVSNVSRTISIQADNSSVSDCIVRSYPGFASTAGIFSQGDNGTHIYNNIIYGGYSGGGIYLAWITGSAYVYNNTIYGNTNGILIEYSNAVTVLKNNLSYNNTNGNYSLSAYNSALSTNNLSGPSQNDAPGLNPRNATTVSFINIIAGSEDFHVASSDTGAKNFGVDLSSDLNLPFTTDIDGQSRSGLNWDIGADEATFNGPFTVQAWVKPDATPASKAIMAKAEELRMATDGSGKPLCQIKSGFTWQTAAVSSEALSVNQWSHVACSYDQSNLKIYVNGVEKGSQALTVGVDNMTSNWKIGTDDSSDGTYGEWDGLVDDFQFYDYARVPEQIVEDLNAGHPSGGSPVGSPLTDYNFDEGSSGDAHNRGSGGAGFNGSLNSGSGGSNTSASQMWSLDGYYGKAVELDGTDDRVSLPDVGY